MRNSKLFSLTVAATLFFVVTLTSCGGDLPNGRYNLTSGDFMYIIIDGKNYTSVVKIFDTEVKETVKYECKDGWLILKDDDGKIEKIPCEFKNDTLWCVGIPYATLDRTGKKTATK